MKIDSSQAASEFARQFYFDDISIYESFFLILLNNSLNTHCKYKELPNVLKALLPIVLIRQPRSFNSFSPLFSENAELDIVCISVLSERSKIPSWCSFFNADDGTSRNLLPLRMRISRLYNPSNAFSDNVAKLLDAKSNSRNNEQQP